MKKILCSIFLGLCLSVTAAVARVPLYEGDDANFSVQFSCGAGYVLASHDKIDGINARECVKLWCRDLETNNAMGSGTRVASGYVDKLSETTDGRETVECFGERKWCAGEPAGVWAPDLGIYVRGGDDGSTYTAYQKGSCFAWRLEKPECAAGESAILRNGEWVCVTASTGNTNTVMKSSVRRTGTMRRVVR